jgi:hypothetical protein
MATKKNRPMSADMLLTLCRSASMISKDTPMLVDKKNKRAVKGLVERKFMTVNDKGETTPTMAGFREIKGLAPVPMVLVREMAAEELAPKAKAAFLEAAGLHLAHLFADNTEFNGLFMKDSKSIRTLEQLRETAHRAGHNGVVAMIDAENVATTIPVYGSGR